MARSDEAYRQYVPGFDISIEKNTTSVPRDGKYYLVRGGQVVKAFRTLKQADAAFKEALTEAGYTPRPVEKQAKSATEEDIERYLDAKDVYWAESYKYRGKGGKGGRGGV
jgi:hypothetical protein